MARRTALFVAVTLQAALGIITLLRVVPIPLALSHQATAIVVLTVAVVHAAQMTRRPRDRRSTRGLPVPTSSSVVSRPRG